MLRWRRQRAPRLRLPSKSHSESSVSSGQALKGDTTMEIEAVRRSGLFDAVWYAERTPEVASFSDPVTHYLKVGARAGIAPHPLFHVVWYLDSHPSARKSGLSPLGHFVLLGEAAGASVCPLFDPEWYRHQVKSLASVREGLFRHFLQTGAAQGLSPHPAFDPAYYRSLRPDISSTTNPLTHFFEVGAAGGTPPNPFFDPEWYAATVASNAEWDLIRSFTS